MEDAGGFTGGGAPAASSSSASTLLCGGGRQRFEVELRPGETTIVSWKKLMKDANKAAANKNNNDENKRNEENKNVKDVVVAVDPVPVPAAVNPALDSRIAPVSGDIAENEGGDVPPGSRFSAVIEKIERLYMGKNSSDEEDLNDVPDDDEYDTEDSFIDDAELDDYFQVDNSAIKHDGFFVNRGKLERTNEEPTALPTEQPKKRRRKDSTKGDNGSNDGHMPNKQMKVNKNEKKKVVTSVDKNSITPSRSITLQTNNEDLKYQSPIIALGTVVKKPSDSENMTDPSQTRGLNGDARATAKNIEKQKTGVVQPKKHGSKLKDGSQTPVLPNQKTNDKGADESKSQGQLVNNSEELNQSVLPREKNVIYQPADKASEITPQPKTTHMVRKDGSSSKPKSTNLLLEKAIRDLEKTVAEVRPPSMEVTEADTSAQAVKRRMPPEIKQKLAKVARLAHAIHGKLSKELLNRLLSIVGHLIQLRSLKRNLLNMVEMGLSAKEEKDGKVQQLKKEVDEMVKLRAPMMKPKAIEQQAGSSDDFQGTSSTNEKVKSQFLTDDALEDKICDLYDLYVEGLDEDAGSQVRKLYAELADLWPKGCMDNHGIKRAICRAKDRRKALSKRKDQESLKRKKLLSTKTEAGVVAGSVGQVQNAPDKLVTDSSAPVRSITKTISASAPALPPNSSNDGPKQEKLKGISNNQNNKTGLEVLVKKKAKKKPEAESGDGQVRTEKSTLAHGKQMIGGLVKAVTQPSIAPASAPAPAGAPPAQPAVSNPVDLV